MTETTTHNAFVRALLARRIRGVARDVALFMLTERNPGAPVGEAEFEASDALLARELRAHRRTIRRAKAELRAAGFLETVERPGLSNLYRLAIPKDSR